MNTYTLTILLAILATGLSVVVRPPQNRDSVAETIQGEICNRSKTGLYQMYKSFHSGYGLTQPPAIIVTPLVDTSTNILLKSFRSCPGAAEADVVWCVRLATELHDVTACINSTGGVSATPIASLLGMEENIEFDSTGSLVLRQLENFYSYALVSALVRGEGCVDASHYVLYINFNTKMSPSLVDFPNETLINVSPKEETYLNCTYLTNTRYHEVIWVHLDAAKPNVESTSPSIIPILHEDPYCQGGTSACRKDVRYPEDHPIRSYSVKSYSYRNHDCLQSKVYRHNVLAIQGDTTSLYDGRYACQLYKAHSSRPLLSAETTVEIAQS